MLKKMCNCIKCKNYLKRKYRFIYNISSLKIKLFYLAIYQPLNFFVETKVSVAHRSVDKNMIQGFETDTGSMVNVSNFFSFIVADNSAYR